MGIYQAPGSTMTHGATAANSTPQTEPPTHTSLGIPAPESSGFYTQYLHFQYREISSWVWQALIN